MWVLFCLFSQEGDFPCLGYKRPSRILNIQPHVALCSTAQSCSSAVCCQAPLLKIGPPYLPCRWHLPGPSRALLWGHHVQLCSVCAAQRLMAEGTLGVEILSGPDLRSHAPSLSLLIIEKGQIFLVLKKGIIWTCSDPACPNGPDHPVDHPEGELSLLL